MPVISKSPQLVSLNSSPRKLTANDTMKVLMNSVFCDLLLECPDFSTYMTVDEKGVRHYIVQGAITGVGLHFCGSNAAADALDAPVAAHGMLHRVFGQLAAIVRSHTKTQPSESFSESRLT